jgi:hypothetical protein
MDRAGIAEVKVSLSIGIDHYEALRTHLFPGDGCEAVALMLCGRFAGNDRHRLLVREVIFIPYEVCRRSKDQITWPTEYIETSLNRAEELGLSVVKIHSHPQGYAKFSDTDDASDQEFLPVVRAWVGWDVPHASMVMLPNGRMFGRFIWRGALLDELNLVAVAGPDLHFWWGGARQSESKFGESQDQAFGEGTTKRLARLKAAVVGASGTGSPTTEQLIRLGIGDIVNVDPDKMEWRNLNRILHASVTNAIQNKSKVEVAAEAASRTGLPTQFHPISLPLGTPEAIREVASCDVLFGCVDTHSARFLMNLLASHYLIPYFDIGVMIDAEPTGKTKGAIKDIFGSVHYMVPGRSSLLSREVISLDRIAWEGLKESDPEAAAQQVADKYIKGVAVSRPAVISVNMLASSLAVNDFLARLHPYRRRPNGEVASIEFSLGDVRMTSDEELEPCPVMGRYLGHGDRVPLLGLLELQEKKS